MQKTLASIATFKGYGLHSGKRACLAIMPARAGTGIVFRRVDLQDSPEIPARWDHVIPSRLCTLLDNGYGVTLSTVEHVMAALAGLGITDATLEVDGPEVPILDGSSREIVAGIRKAGIRGLAGESRRVRVLKPVIVQENDAFAMLAPGKGLRIQFKIEFPDAAIGVQEFGLDIDGDSFERELADCRTFCRASDVDAMRRNGLALGGTFENAVVYDGDRVLSPGGLRRRDEAVRHKMLDALGDLALAGASLTGHYTGYKAGHALTNRLLHALFADKDAWAFQSASKRQLADA